MKSRATAPSNPTHHLCSGGGGCDQDGGGGGGSGGHHFLFSAPASPVHYILRSPPSSTAVASSVSTHYAYAPATDGDCCGSTGFQFATRHHGAGVGMSSAEELFLAGRIRVGCLSPICQETAYGEQEDGDDGEGKGGVDGDATQLRRTRSASSPRLAKSAEPSDSFASASASSSAKYTRRRISLRDLLGRTGSDSAVADRRTAAGSKRSGFWPPSIWPSRPPAAQPGRRSTSSDRAAPSKRVPGGAAREEPLPYRQGLVLEWLGFGARSYGLAKPMHPLPSR